MYDNYTIALCDILGFKAIVSDNPLQQVVANSIGWLRKSLHHSLHHDEFPEAVPTLEELEDQSAIGLAWFSDTMLLYTLEDTEACIQSLLTALGFLTFETIITARTMIRCAVAYGPAYMDRNESLYVGDPIVEAYELEQRQQWAGGCLTHAARDRLPAQAQTGEFADWWLVPYEVPLKRNTPFQSLAINWPQGFHHPSWHLRWSDDSIGPTEAECQERPSLCEKFLNTVAFHDSVCSTCS